MVYNDVTSLSVSAVGWGVARGRPLPFILDRCVMPRTRPRANVYVDGFNLYYGAVKDTPHEWLDIGKLCRMILPEYQIHRLHYFTARVQAWPEDPDQPIRQQTYLRALATIPHLRIHYGQFTVGAKRRRLAGPQPEGTPRFANVLIPEEKGSDVNLASHLLMDGFEGDYDVAVVVSNDSDLLEPIRLVRDRLKHDVGVINPYKNARAALQQEAAFYRTISAGALRASHFPPTLHDKDGVITKPLSW